MVKHVMIHFHVCQQMEHVENMQCTVCGLCVVHMLYMQYTLCMFYAITLQLHVFYM